MGHDTRTRVRLTTSDVNRLGKWASPWFDLLHVDMVLEDRVDTPEPLADRKLCYETGSGSAIPFFAASSWRSYDKATAPRYGGLPQQRRYRR